MKQIRLLKWLIEVDQDKTKEFYSKDIELCDCLYCENYMEACMHIEPSILELFTAVGINPFLLSQAIYLILAKWKVDCVYILEVII